MNLPFEIYKQGHFVAACSDLDNAVKQALKFWDGGKYQVIVTFKNTDATILGLNAKYAWGEK